MASQRYFPLLATALSFLGSAVVSALTLPSGFVATQVASGLTSPTAIHALPDGRLLVNEQDGRVRVIKNGVILPTPFATFSVDTFEERGLLGVVSDPGFAQNGFIYFYYTVSAAASPDGKPRNRLVRVKASGDVMEAGSQVVLVDFPEIAAGIRWHMGGHLEFGPDGMLYVGQGIHEDNSTSQSLNSPRGKILRFDVASWAGRLEDLMPLDNPFYAQTTGINKAIWAIGLRNPFTFAIQKSSGKLWANDVGSEWNGERVGSARFKDGWEEVNNVVKGGNYGWPLSEGAGVGTGQTAPIYTYGHRSYPGATDNFNDACTIGGAFYEPTVKTFPAQYHGKYFFADMIYGWIRTMDPQATNPASTIADFATVAGPSASDFPTGLFVDESGNLWVLSRGRTADGNIGSGQGRILRISYSANSAPQIGTPPADTLVAEGETAKFSVTAYGTPPFTYQWLQNGQPISTTTVLSAASETLLLPTTLADNETQISVRVSSGSLNTTSTTARLRVAAGSRPQLSILEPVLGSTYKAGDVIRWKATANDGQDGLLPPSAFSWRVFFRLHVDHPFRLPTTGQNEGSFDIPPESPAQSQVYFTLEVTATDSSGLSTTLQRNITPTTSTFTLDTSPVGLTYELDSVPRTASQTFTGVVGVLRHLNAPAEQTLNGKTYRFDRWSHGAGLDHRWPTANAPTALTAIFREGTALTPLETWRQTHFANWVNSGTGADNADPDSDGLPNLVEYAAGLLPKTHNPSPFQTTIVNLASQPYGSLSLSLAGTTSGLTLLGEASNDLIHWQSSEAITTLNGASLTIRDVVPITGETTRYLRLKVTR